MNVTELKNIKIINRDYYSSFKGMWYLWKQVSLCKKVCSVFTCLRPKNIKICFQN